MRYCKYRFRYYGKENNIYEMCNLSRVCLIYELPSRSNEFEKLLDQGPKNRRITVIILVKSAEQPCPDKAQSEHYRITVEMLKKKISYLFYKSRRIFECYTFSFSLSFSLSLIISIFSCYHFSLQPRNL